MSVTASSYSITMRLHTAPDHGVVGAVATAISSAGGVVTAIDVGESTRERLVVDVTCSAADDAKRTMTDASILIDLDARVMHVANGPPCSNEHVPFPLEED